MTLPIQIGGIWCCQGTVTPHAEVVIRFNQHHTSGGDPRRSKSFEQTRCVLSSSACLRICSHFPLVFFYRESIATGHMLYVFQGTVESPCAPDWGRGSSCHLLWKIVRPPRSEGFLFKGSPIFLAKGGKKTPLAVHQHVPLFGRDHQLLSGSRIGGICQSGHVGVWRSTPDSFGCWTKPYEYW